MTKRARLACLIVSLPILVVGVLATPRGAAAATGWTLEDSGVQSTLTGISCADVDHCVIVGGTVYAPPPPSPTPCPPGPPCHGLARTGGDDGNTILARERDGTWTAQYGGDTYLTGVSCPDAGHCWAVGEAGVTQGSKYSGKREGTVMFSAGDGKWSTQRTYGAPSLTAISCLKPAVCRAVGWGYSVDSADGRVWSAPVTNPATSLGPVGLVSVACVAAGRCWAGANDGRIVRNPGTPAAAFEAINAPSSVPLGMSCLEGASSGAHCWVAESVAAENFFFSSGDGRWAPGARDPLFNNRGLNAISCPDDRHCWGVGDNGRVAFSGQDGRWVTQESGTRENLNAVSFPSPCRGWAVGDNGTVVGFKDESCKLDATSASTKSGGAGAQGGNPNRSTIASALRAPAAVSTEGRLIATNATLAILMVLLLTFPAELFNSTLEEHYHEVLGWFAGPVRLFGRFRPRRVESRDRKPSAVRGFLSYGLVAVLGAGLGGLLDPTFGPTLASAALFVAVLLSLFTGAVVSAISTGSYLRARRKPTAAYLRGLPLGLLIAGMCVLVSRLTRFEPGYLYGLIGGIAFRHKLTDKQAGQAVALGSVLSLGVSVAAWLAWIPVHAAAEKTSAGFPVLVADSYLAAMFVGGLVGLVVGLVPLRYLPGHKLAGWSRVAWVIVVGIACFGLVHVILHPESGFIGKSYSASLFTTAALFGAFAILSFSFWGYFRVRSKPDPAKLDK